MKKRFILVALFATVVLLGGCNFMGIEDEIFDERIDRAIEAVVAEFPSFVAVREETYVAVHRTENRWFAYVFSELDGSLGAEVYYEDGVYTVNFDYRYHQFRVRLITRMNELMPELRETNRFMSWSIPTSLRYRTISRGTSNHVSYVVIRDVIDVNRQLEIDFEILRYAHELSEELGLELQGMSVRYFEGNIEDVRITNETGHFRNVERSLSLFIPANQPHFEREFPNLTPITRYRVTDLLGDFERAISSRENFENAARYDMRTFYERGREGSVIAITYQYSGLTD